VNAKLVAKKTVVKRYNMHTIQKPKHKNINQHINSCIMASKV